MESQSCFFAEYLSFASYDKKEVKQRGLARHVDRPGMRGARGGGWRRDGPVRAHGVARLRAFLRAFDSPDLRSTWRVVERLLAYRPRELFRRIPARRQARSD